MDSIGDLNLFSHQDFEYFLGKEIADRLDVFIAKIKIELERIDQLRQCDFW